MSGRATELRIDWTRCDGHGLCASLIPELLTADEWGFPVRTTTPMDGGLVVHARRAATACPALALRLETS
jgi:ferredoxin